MKDDEATRRVIIDLLSKYIFSVNEDFLKASRNIEGLDILPTMGANVFDILKRDTLVITKSGIEALEARLK